MRADELLLFPLHTVLYPGGELRLRVFEARYLELVRHCSGHNQPFGVVLILEGQDVGAPALPAALGTTARITDFYSLEGGLLGITARGESCFHARRTRVRDNGLIVADIEPVLEPQLQRVQPQHGILVLLLERLLERAGGVHAKAPRRDLDDAAWVGYRLAELLPFSPIERQVLLECRDPQSRLERILRRIPEWQRE